MLNDNGAGFQFSLIFFKVYTNLSPLKYLYLFSSKLLRCNYLELSHILIRALDIP